MPFLDIFSCSHTQVETCQRPLAPNLHMSKKSSNFVPQLCNTQPTKHEANYLHHIAGSHHRHQRHGLHVRDHFRQSHSRRQARHAETSRQRLPAQPGGLLPRTALCIHRTGQLHHQDRRSVGRHQRGRTLHYEHSCL